MGFGLQSLLFLVRHAHSLSEGVRALAWVLAVLFTLGGVLVCP